MDWIPVVLVTFKMLVLGIGMFFAIKWHYDKGKKEEEKKEQNRALLRASGKVVAIFVLLLLGVGIVTYLVVSKLGLELAFS